MSVLPRLHDYPTDVLAPVNVVLAKLRGEDVPKLELAHAGWHVAGFGLGQFDYHPPIFGGKETKAEVTLSDDALKCWLEEIAAGKHNVCRLGAGPAVAVDVNSVPWDLIISTILRLIEAWLAK